MFEKKFNNLKISSFQLIKYRCLVISFIRCPDGILLTFVSADDFCLVCWLILSYCPRKMFSFLIRDVCGDKADSQKYSKDYGFVSLITTIKRGTFQLDCTFRIVEPRSNAIGCDVSAIKLFLGSSESQRIIQNKRFVEKKSYLNVAQSG